MANVDVRDHTIAVQSQRIVELNETVRNLSAQIQQLQDQLRRAQSITSPILQTVTTASVPTPSTPRTITQAQTQTQPQQRRSVPAPTSSSSSVAPIVRGISKRRRTSRNGERRSDSPRAIASPRTTSRNLVSSTRVTPDVLRRNELRASIKRPRTRQNSDAENELLRRFMSHGKVCRYCLQPIRGQLYKLRSSCRDLPGRKYCCSEPDCLSIDRHLWARVKCRWDTVPTAPLSEEVHGHSRDPVMHLRKCLAQLGYTSGDATVDIWEVVHDFRVRHKLFGPRMRVYTKAMQAKLKMLVEKARERGWRASVDFSAGCDPVFVG